MGKSDALAVGAIAVQMQAVFGKGEAETFGDFFLTSFDQFVGELIDLAALDANDMVVMATAVEFKNGIATFEMMPVDQASGFELRQYTVHRRQTNLLTFSEQDFIELLRGQMAFILLFLEDFQNLQPGRSHLQASVA